MRFATGKVEILQFYYKDFIDDDKGLFILGVDTSRLMGVRAPALRPDRVYLSTDCTAIKPLDNRLFTTRYNYNKLIQKVRERERAYNRLFKYTIPEPIHTQWSTWEDYNFFLSLHGYDTYK